MTERRVFRDQLKEGMLITADVYTYGGLVVVPENTVVTKEVIELLTRHSIVEVIIGEEIEMPEFSMEDLGLLDDVLGMVEMMEADQESLEQFSEGFHVAEETLSESLRNIASQDGDIDVQQLLDMVDSVAAKASNDINLCGMLMKMKEDAKNLYTHSINVSLYAQLLAKWLDFSEEDIEMVGIAGLLHDIGLLKCQMEGEEEILFHDEYENRSGINHMIHGYNIIKDKDLDLKVKQAVLTHHERMDLSGFPYKMSYKNINNISRVLAIADAYDTLTMEEEGYEPMSPFEVLGLMYDTCYIRFDSEMLVLFIEHMAQNFIQYEVLLSDGRTAKIVMTNKYNVARPLVMSGTEFIDLSQRKDITIKKILN